MTLWRAAGPSHDTTLSSLILQVFVGVDGRRWLSLRSASRNTCWKSAFVALKLWLILAIEQYFCVPLANRWAKKPHTIIKYRSLNSLGGSSLPSRSSCTMKKPNKHMCSILRFDGQRRLLSSTIQCQQYTKRELRGVLQWLVERGCIDTLKLPPTVVPSHQHDHYLSGGM